MADAKSETGASKPGIPVAKPTAQTPAATSAPAQDGAKTDRPAAPADEVKMPTTAGSAPPFGDQITQGGSAGPPDQIRVEPASLAADQAAAAARVTRTFDAAHYTHSRQLLTEEKLAGMSRPAILAVAHDRGYKDVDVGGKRSIVRNFLAAQGKDESEDLHEAGTLEEAAQEQAAGSATGPITEDQYLSARQGTTAADDRAKAAQADEVKVSTSKSRSVQ